MLRAIIALPPTLFARCSIWAMKGNRCHIFVGLGIYTSLEAVERAIPGLIPRKNLHAPDVGEDLFSRLDEIATELGMFSTSRHARQALAAKGEIYPGTKLNNHILNNRFPFWTAGAQTRTH